MTFQQLHYTSCPDGPAGFSGFQFSAVSPDIEPAVLREVEELTVYQPPSWLLASPQLDQPDAYPVMFLHAASAVTGATITAQVVFAGTDYSGRPGNYFAHTLLTSTPAEDFGPVRPAELWGSELWQRTPAIGTELPALAGPPPRGFIDPPGAQAFLEAHGLDGILGELLTAVGRAMAGAPPVLLVTMDATECAWCIATLSYLLGEQLAQQLTFSTYCHRPESARLHVIGILPDAMPADAFSGSFQLFDLTTGRIPGDGVHPLAELLASTGVLAAPALWHQAMALSSGAEQHLDDWLPVVAAAAGLLGRPLSPAERAAVARWAGPAVRYLPAEAADAVLGLLLDQPDQPLTGARLIHLLSLAGQAGAAARVARLEDLLIEDMVSQVRAGQPVAAAESPGADRADPAADLAGLLHRSPGLVRSLVSRLDSEPPELAEAVLAGPAGAVIGRDDLAGLPTLTELWLLRSAAQGTMPPVRALDEIADTRHTAGRSPRVDLGVLTRLWPAGCPAGELTELLGLIADDPPADVGNWITAEVSALARYGEPDGDWYRLAATVVGHPVQGALLSDELQIMQNAARAGPLLARARAGAPAGGAAVFAELFALHASAADSRTRGLLEQDLPGPLAGAVPLGPALRGCPAEIALTLGAELASRLAARPADVPLAAQVFAALADPEVAAQPVLAEQLTVAAGPVHSWSRHDLTVLGRTLDGDEAAAGLFRTWRGSTGPARLWRWPL
jgi:GTPase-associated protein 1, N-terminal domain type 2/GTPase-associated protein 1, middle domain/GTPase-associated protein 1, C-terminal domain